MKTSIESKPIVRTAVAAVCLLTLWLAPEAEAKQASQGESAQRGVAILASTIGDKYQVDDLVHLIERGCFSPVVVDWAWITYHWERTKWDEVKRMVRAVQAKGIHVAAMYRPRSLNAPNVPTQVKRDGSNAYAHGYHVSYFEPQSRAWALQWGGRMLSRCPEFDEIIIYNPLNRDESPAALDAQRHNPNANRDAVLDFLEEARGAWRKLKPDVQLGLVYVPDPDFWAAAEPVIDAAHPFVTVRNEADMSREVALYEAIRERIGSKAQAALAKTEWEADYAVSPQKLAELQRQAAAERMPYFFWTLGSVLDPRRYALQDMASALNVPQRLLGRFVPARPTPVARQPTRAVPRAEIDRYLQSVHVYSNNQEQVENIQRLARLAKEPETREYIIEAATAIALGSQHPANQRWMCCYVLSEIGDPRSAEVLLPLLGSEPNAIIRSVVAAALKPYHTPEVRAALEDAVQNDPSERVRESARRTLGRMDGKRPPPGVTAERPPRLAPPTLDVHARKLPWPHQAPDLSAAAVADLNQDVWVINNFPLYQANREGTHVYLHGGLDIVLPNGTRIYAMKDGWVKSIAVSTVTIADTQGDAPTYGWEYTHLANFQVAVGDFVRRGTWIGEVSFKGLDHIHLAKVYSAGPHWGGWRYLCPPEAHFAYTDTTPPVVQRPLHFFRNNQDARFEPDTSGATTVSGDVDIVVGIRDAGRYAYSRDLQFGDRLAPARIDYSIRPVDAVDGPLWQYRSFDFAATCFLASVYNRAFNAKAATSAFKHYTLCEEGERGGNKIYCYYVITNSPGDAPPRVLNATLRDHCWRTAARTAEGLPLFPNGKYEIEVTVTDFSGNASTERDRVQVEN